MLCMTDPPVIADIALLVARRFGAPLVVVSQDVFPEIAVELKRLENPASSASCGAIGFYLERADRVVAIGETMRSRLEEKGARPSAIRVIPNWVDTGTLMPQPRDNAWGEEHGLAERFVVMHSGNVGHAQNLDALVRAATFLRDLDDSRSRSSATAPATPARGPRPAARRRPVAVLATSRAISRSRSRRPNVHVVGLARGLSGYVVPSRLYGILSVGRPVIVAADEESETAQLVEQVGCGVVVPPGRPELLAEAIRAAHDGEFDLEAMGAAGASTSRARPTAASRSGATGACSATSSGT